ELTNELGTLNETLKEQIDMLSEKNETIQIELDKKARLYEQAQDRLNKYRDEYYQIRESLEGEYEDITEDRNWHIAQELQNCQEHGRNLQNDK
ncbi:1256_t:CDS:2, partial [Diversispora eburnea]